MLRSSDCLEITITIRQDVVVEVEEEGWTGKTTRMEGGRTGNHMVDDIDGIDPPQGDEDSTTIPSYYHMVFTQKRTPRVRPLPTRELATLVKM